MRSLNRAPVMDTPGENGQRETGGCERSDERLSHSRARQQKKNRVTQSHRSEFINKNYGTEISTEINRIRLSNQLEMNINQKSA